MAPVLAESIPFRLGLWLMGGAFLIYLGATNARPRTILPARSTDEKGLGRSDAARAGVGTPSSMERKLRGDLHPFLTGLGMTLLNPMTIASWLAIGGAFFSTIALVERGTFGGAVFAVGIFAGSALWFSGIAIVLHFARRWVNDRSLRVVSLIASLMLMAFGASFLVQAALIFRGYVE